MKVGFLSDKNGFRAPLHPDSLTKYNKTQLFVEKDIFKNIDLESKDYKKLKPLNKTVLKQMDVVCFVDSVDLSIIKSLKPNTKIIGLFDDKTKKDIKKIRSDVALYDFFKLPRISRAQNMDALSSQANLLGYASVLRASLETSNVLPMMTTAAGNISPAKVLILGIGVAGLQAIATAKRLGARVWGYDVRADVKDQVESLGAKFVEANSSSQDGVYAKELTKKEQADLKKALSNQVIESDIVLTFAQIPGKKAPLLIDKKTVSKMKKNSVIVDLAAGTGGNCELTKAGKVVKKDGVKIVGEMDILKNVKHAATKLYSENIRNLVQLLEDNPEDEIFVEMSS
ncbi:MAG: NAD(P)(+) transhydrogenase (Re/Si-specific) subunit alpha [Candidatus Actinomarina sp.]|jgi:NAD(P) transhydrogenase subunit alpha|tara:strand:+ start:265 stop:1287 length:1023 start_codon:yes stop_codon:yes gene_type:complete